MIKKYLKQIIIFLVILLIQSGCKLPTEEEYIPPYIDPGTGMWLVGKLNTSGDARNVKGYTISGIQYAFLADGQNGMQIISISNPSAPILISNYHTSGFTKEIFIDSIRSNKYAFISDSLQGLFIVNITNPLNPLLDTLLAYQGGINSAYSKNGYLYVSSVSGFMKIININSLPDSVYEVSSYFPVNPITHIEISGSTAYLIESITGLEMVNISNPSNPIFISTFRTSGSCNFIKIAEQLAYVADGTVGLTVINIGNPAQPYFVRSINTSSNILAVDYSPNFLFTAESNYGTEVFNLFDPTHPDEFGYFEPSGKCYGVCYFRGKVLIANGQNGLLILRF